MNVYDLKLAKQKIQDYCAYQERCHQEVSSKLKSWGLIPDAIDMLLGELMQHNFLNEERYAKAFVRGKFSIKKWGKIKIINQLKFKGISEYNIKSSLKEIDSNEYLTTLQAIAEKKIPLIKESNSYKKSSKLATFLISKGFESELVFKTVKTLI